MSVPIPQFIPRYLSPPVSTYPFSTSASLFLPCKYVHVYHFSRCHLYALLYNVCFPLSDLLRSVSPWIIFKYTKEKTVVTTKSA